MIQFIKTILFAIKKRYGYYAQELGDSEMQEVQKRVCNKHSTLDLSHMQYGGNKYIFPSYEAFEKACKAFIEEEKTKESEQVSTRPRRSVQPVDKTEVRKERISKVRNLHSPKTSKGDAKRTLRKPSTQSNKVGRRKLPPSVRGL